MYNLELYKTLCEIALYWIIALLAICVIGIALSKVIPILSRIKYAVRRYRRRRRTFRLKSDEDCIKWINRQKPSYRVLDFTVGNKN